MEELLSPPRRTPSLQWVMRDAEQKLFSMVQAGSFIHVRGRRRTGMTSTVKTVLEHTKIPYVLVTLRSDAALNVRIFKKEFEAIGIECIPSPDTEADLEDLLLKALRGGANIAIEEIQRASAILQGVLQVVVDKIQFDKQHGGDDRRYGSIIVLGSLPLMVDEVLEGAERPLYGRFTQKIRIAPFLANELSWLFQAYGIKCGATMLAVYTATGGIPALLNCLSDARLLTDGVSLEKMLHAIYASGEQSHTTSMTSFYMAELPLHYKAVNYVYLRGKGKSVASQISELQTELNKDRASHPASTMLNTLCSHHGTIIKLCPISPSVCSMSLADKADASTATGPKKSAASVRETYIVDDPALQTFHELKITSAGTCEDVVVSSITASEKDCATSEGFRLERWARSILVHRYAAGYAAIPGMSDLTKPAVLRGHWGGFHDTEIDIVSVFHTEKVLVLGSVKRDADKAVAALCDRAGAKNLYQSAIRLRKQLQNAKEAGIVLTQDEGGMLNYTVRLVGITASAPKDCRTRVSATACAAADPLCVDRMMLLDLPQMLQFDDSERWKPQNHGGGYSSAALRNEKEVAVSHCNSGRSSDVIFFSLVVAVCMGILNHVLKKARS